MLVKGAIKTLGGDRPCIIGNKLKVHYHRGENYMECNINIGSSMIARNVAGVAMKQGGKRLIVDQTFLIEGQEIDELPERLIGGSRVTPLILTHAGDYQRYGETLVVPGTESLAESAVVGVLVCLGLLLVWVCLSVNHYFLAIKFGQT